MTIEDTELHALQSELAGTWSIEREIGRGGMGRVFLAREVALDRPVAIKVLDPALARRDDIRQRFVQEARTNARLAHPNIVPIYAVGEVADTVFFAMGLVDGESVGARVLREGPLATEDALRIAQDAGAALAHAHAMGVLHRDVTLDNILLERGSGRAILVDFGIAANVEAAGTAALVGTPAYIAPELIQGAAPSPQSDLYSLGVALWTMLAGRLPYPDADVTTVLLQQVRAPIPSLAEAAAGTPRRVQRAVERALAKDPDDRPRDIEAWLRELGGDEEPRALAAPIQAFLDRWQGIRVFYALGVSITAMVLAINGSVIDYVWSPLWLTVVRFLAPYLLMLPLVGIVHVNILLRLLRRLARAGYGLADIHLALARRRAEAAREQPTRATALQRFTVLATILSLATWFAARQITRYFGRMNFYLATEPDWLLQAMRWAELVFWSCISVSIVNPPLQLRRDGRLARQVELFWHGLRARALMSLSQLFLPKGRAAHQTLHRPTELVLDLAIDDLWAALPRTQRMRIRDVPTIANALRLRVTSTREILRRLDEATQRTDGEIGLLRDRIKRQERAAITSLERLRLGLMQLTSEAGSPSEFSQILTDAATLQGELLAELGAAREVVARVVKQRRLGTGSSPTPTPSPA